MALAERTQEVLLCGRAPIHAIAAIAPINAPWGSSLAQPGSEQGTNGQMRRRWPWHPKGRCEGAGPGRAYKGSPPLRPRVYAPAATKPSTHSMEVARLQKNGDSLRVSQVARVPHRQVCVSARRCRQHSQPPHWQHSLRILKVGNACCVRNKNKISLKKRGYRLHRLG